MHNSFIMIAFLIFIFILTTNASSKSGNFVHSDTPTHFGWYVLEDCLDICTLNVNVSNSNTTIPFNLRKMYTTCEYKDNYTWNITCDDKNDHYNPKCVGNILKNFYQYPMLSYYASKTQKKDERDNLRGLISINIPSCDNIVNNECLFVEFHSEYYDFTLKYYDKNEFNCTYVNNDKYNVPVTSVFVSHDHMSHVAYSAKFKLGCHNDAYIMPDMIKIGDTYNFEVSKNDISYIKYYIGKDQLTVEQIVTLQTNNSLIYIISLIILFVIMLILAIGLCLMRKHYENKIHNLPYMKINGDSDTQL